jgi:hypothetical protein
MYRRVEIAASIRHKEFKIIYLKQEKWGRIKLSFREWGS